MMFDSILVKVSCSEELLYLHTISRRHKSPYRFAILRDTLEQLEREPGRQIIVADCGCYAALRLTRALDGEMLVIRFSWLQSAGADSLRGYEEWVRLPYRRFHECVEAGTDMAGWNWSQLSVPEKVTRRFEFHSRQNLHQIAQRPLLRHKLGKTLEHHFQWRDAEKILIYDDGAPYSFFFEEYTPYGRGICGGIILFTMMDSIGRTNYGLAVMLGAFVSGTMLLGFSEIIRLLHEINQKTR